MNARTRPMTLDELARMDSPALGRLYADGSVPDSLAALDGEPTCRMLAIDGVAHGGVFDRIRRLAAWSRFPWAGKAFQSVDGDHGHGINRVRLDRMRRWYPFQTRVEPSAIDGAPCIYLDYRDPDNPFFIRAIRDELREVSPGLFIGPAMLETAKQPPRLVLWFACDTRR